LVFEYRASSGTAVSAASSALGVVILATDYDALNAPFSDKQSMESYEFATSTVPFSGCLHPVECARGSNVLSSLYTRKPGALPAGADLRFYDMGNFQIATQGMQSSYVVGELWVTYDIRLIKPRLDRTIVPIVDQGFAILKSSPNNSATVTQIFGTAGGIVVPGSTLVSSVGILGNSVLLSEAGTYVVVTLAASLVAVTGSYLPTLGANLATALVELIGTNAYGALGTPTFGVVFHAVEVSASGLSAANLYTYGATEYAGFDGGNLTAFVMRLDIPSSMKRLRASLKDLEYIYLDRSESKLPNVELERMNV